MNRLRARLRKDTGASAVEYSLIVVAIAAVVVAVVFTLGQLTHSKFQSTCTAWQSAAGSSAC